MEASVPHRFLDIIHEFPSLEEGKQNVDVLCGLHIQAPKLMNLEERKKPLRISVAMDVSGSMSGEKIRLAKESLGFMVSQLEERDEFGIIAFDSIVEEAFKLTKMTPEGKTAADAAIERMHDRDCTNLSGGLFASILQCHKLPVEQPHIPGKTRPHKMQRISPPQQQEQQEEDQIEDQLADLDSDEEEEEVEEVKEATATPPLPVPDTENCSRAVLIFTDGLANEGITQPSALVDALKQHLERFHDDFVVYTFGFGSDHNSDLLRQLAEASQGSYSFLQDTNTMKESFANCLGGLVSQVMAHLELTVQPEPPTTTTRLWTKLPNVKTGENGLMQISLKDLFSEEQRDILIQLQVPLVPPAGGQVKMFTACLSFENILTRQREEVTVQGVLPATKDAPAGPPNAQLDEQRNRMHAVEEMEAARLEAEAGRMVEARERVKRARAKIVTSASKESAFTKNVMQELYKAEECMEDEQQFRSVGGKKMARMVVQQAQQRCNDAEDEAMYENAWARQMKSSAKSYKR